MFTFLKSLKLLILISIFSNLSCKEKTTFEGRTPQKQPAAKTQPTPAPKTETPKTEDVVTPPVDVPENAVTKGSFTVYTEPKDPQPREDYKVVVLITLPSGTTTYNIEDLSGTIIGTDGYKQDIRNSYKKKDGFFDFLSKDKYDITKVEGNLPIENGRAKHIIDVPGAEKLVEDTIDVASILLNEKQNIKIVF